MRRRLIVVLWLGVLTVAVPASAVLTGPVVVDCALFAKESITVSSTAVGLTAATYTSGGRIANCAILTVETDSLRWFADGSTATSSAHLAAVNDVIVLRHAAAVARFSAIRVTTDATVRASYGFH